MLIFDCWNFFFYCDSHPTKILRPSAVKILVGWDHQQLVLIKHISTNSHSVFQLIALKCQVDSKQMLLFLKMTLNLKLMPAILALFMLTSYLFIYLFFSWHLPGRKWAIILFNTAKLLDVVWTVVKTYHLTLVIKN